MARLFIRQSFKDNHKAIADQHSFWESIKNSGLLYHEFRKQELKIRLTRLSSLLHQFVTYQKKSPRQNQSQSVNSITRLSMYGSFLFCDKKDQLEIHKKMTVLIDLENKFAYVKIQLDASDDKPDFEYALRVTQQLQLLKCEIQWLDIKQLMLPAKGDFIDWLAQHPNATQQDLTDLPLVQPLKNPLAENKSVQEITNLFISNAKGVFYLGDEEARWICSPLTIKALVRDKLSENWGRLLEFTDADGQLHQWAMPMEMLKGNGEELRGELLRQGLEIATGIKTRNRLIEYIVTSKLATRARCVKRTG